MAKTLNTLADTPIGQAAKSLKDVARLRLITGYVLIIVNLIGVLGADWDIQWHATIGRDRTFTPPHDMILIGIGLAGIVALANILIETSWARHNHILQKASGDFLGILHSSLGSYLIGFGAVCSAVAFPLDTYWHSLYGIDVSLWAPFHTMIYMGGVLSTFGIIYMLVSAANLGEAQQERWTVNLSNVGLLITFGILLSKLSTFVTPSLLGQALIRLPFGAIDLFPLLMPFCAAFVCILAVRVLRWPGAATLTVAVFLLVFLLVSAFVPPMMTLLVQAEHQTYLSRAAQIGSRIIPLMGETPFLLLTGICIDGIIWLARRNHWSRTTRNSSVLIATMLSLLVVTALTLITIGTGLGKAHTGTTSHVAVALLISLVLVLPGSFIGSWLGSTIGSILQGFRR